MYILGARSSKVIACTKLTVTPLAIMTTKEVVRYTIVRTPGVYICLETTLTSTISLRAVPTRHAYGGRWIIKEKSGQPPEFIRLQALLSA